MQYRGRPDFFRIQKTFSDSYNDHYFTWYMDFSSKSQKVIALHFDTSNEQEAVYAEKLCSYMQGKSVTARPSYRDIDFDGLYSPVVLSYLSFASFVTGESYSYCEQKGVDGNGLICRCFGVYHEEIVAHLTSGEKSEHTLGSMGEDLNAGIGCGSCHHDIEQLLKLFGHEKLKSSVSEPVTSSASWRDLDDQSVGKKCREVISERKDLKVIGVRPGAVLFSFQGQGLKEKESALSWLKEAIEKTLGEGLEIKLL